MTTVEITGYVPRYDDTINCTCGAKAERVKTTDEEQKKYNYCGHHHSCCDRAFVCPICKTRWVGSAEAPDADEVEGFLQLSCDTPSEDD
jgi:hypothetical protein